MTDLDLLRIQLRKTQELLREALRANDILRRRLARLVEQRLKGKK